MRLNLMVDRTLKNYALNKKYRRRWLLSVCASNSGQQETMRLTGSVRLIKRTYARKAGLAQRHMNADHEDAKCTYDGRKRYEERVFELFDFSNDW